MERKIPTLILLCVVWSAVAALQVDIPKDEYEFARGDNITLPCTFKSTKSNPPLIIISWSAEGPDTPADETLFLTHYHPPGTTDISPKYEGRVSVDVNVASGKADLKLSSITMADNKEFECRVQILGDDEGQPADTARLTVLVAPSKPICKIQGKTEYGQNINLTCYSEEGSPPPTYKWESRDVRNMPRVPDPRTTDKGGILSLFNISKETSGYYTCTSSNKIRSASCNITVTVLPPSMNIGSTAGIIAGVVIGLIILVIAIFCCCRRKNKKGNEEGVSMNGLQDRDDAAKEPLGNGDGHLDVDLEKSRVSKPADRRDDRSDYDDRRSDYDDRRSDYNDRRSDYNDRRSDYDDRRSDYDDRRSDYDDRRSKHSDRHERYDDDRRFEDERRYNDRRDPRYDDDRYNDRDKP
ncbi:cell surface A33 antigen [Fundulus heteroclitus]|uniref:cell surface A33 antigen n=1 Tax=Fundulus heteroclitus TaxID=8078 RepID=UPI00165A2056|nr:cell surface A33 antigen [Fundulus heteroclitus]